MSLLELEGGRFDTCHSHFKGFKMQVEAKIEDILEVVQDGQMKEYEFDLTIKKVDEVCI